MRRLRRCTPVLCLLLLLACNQQPGREFDLDLSKLADSLRTYDSIRIVMRYPDSSVVDTVFHGPILPTNDLSSLPIRDISGEMVVISITGYDGRDVAYHTDRYYNAGTGKTDSSVAWMLPGMSLTLASPDTDITVGDSARLPDVVIKPDNLRDKSIVWRSADSQTIVIDRDYYHAAKAGYARLTARLRGDSSKQASFEVHAVVRATSVLPESLRLAPDTLFLVSHGTGKRFTVNLFPPGVAPELDWSILNGSSAAIDSNGTVTGLSPGTTTILCVSKASHMVSDTGWAKVSDEARVDSVRAPTDTLRLYMGGSGLLLSAKVFPPGANQEVSWSLLEKGIISLSGARVEPVSVGSAHAVVQSQAVPSRTDTVVIQVQERIQIDSIEVSPDSLLLYQGGAAMLLNFQVFPMKVNSRVAWLCRDTTVARVDIDGGVSPVRPGRTRVVAVSLADTTRADSVQIVVKRDPPVLSLGRDTTLQVGATLKMEAKVQQEYGGIRIFRWDLDGNGIWDDSALGLVPLSRSFPDTGLFMLRFYVRDTEGNDTLVARKIHVVRGPLVFIESPLDSQYTNANPIDVVWKVNGVIQAAQNREKLNEGANVITRSASDSTGITNLVSINVFLDTQAPKPPIVSANSPSSSRHPLWTWRGGGGGEGIFRFATDSSALGTAPPSGDTLFSPISPMDSGLRILYVQERDQAENWSIASAKAIRIDLTPPPPPTVALSPTSRPNNPRPGWTWTSPKGDGIGIYRYRLDDSIAATGPETLQPSFATESDLPEGEHVLYVVERDSAGNWSAPGHAAITLDLTPPTPPKVGVQISLSDTTPVKGPVSFTKPVWVWTPGDGGGTGRFRYRMDTADFPANYPSSTARLFATGNPLSEGIHTLFVQEVDSAGNWSQNGQSTVVIDLTPPQKPVVSALSPTNNRQPRWTWVGGGGGAGFFRFCLDCADIGTTYSLTQTTSFVPSNLLSEGFHTLFVQERDSAGNWSNAGTFTLRVDLTPPPNPKIIEKPASPSLLPGSRWSWVSQGGAGYFRYRFDSKNMTGADSGEVTQTLLPSGSLSGFHTLYVQERDSAGNWSGTDSSKALMVADSILGGASLSQGAVTAVDVQMAGNDLYVAFVENGKIIVKRITQNANGTWTQGWTQIGGPVGTNTVSKISLGFIYSNPYLAYEETPTAWNPVRLAKYNGTDWVQADTSGIKMGDVYGDFKLCSYQNPKSPYGPSGQLFLTMVYEETSDPEIQVFRYDNTKWTQVRNGPGIWDRKIASASISDPRVQFADFSLSGVGPNFKLNLGTSGDSNSLVTFTTPIFPQGTRTLSMAIDTLGATYLALNPFSLLKISGGQLQTIPIPTGMTTGNFPLSLFGNNMLYTAYPKGATLEVAALWADGWHTLKGGSATFTSGGIYGLAANYNAVPVVAYSENAMGGALVVRAFGY